MIEPRGVKRGVKSGSDSICGDALPWTESDRGTSAMFLKKRLRFIVILIEMSCRHSMEVYGLLLSMLSNRITMKERQMKNDNSWNIRVPDTNGAYCVFRQMQCSCIHGQNGMIVEAKGKANTPVPEEDLSVIRRWHRNIATVQENAGPVTPPPSARIPRLRTAGGSPSCVHDRD
jgi:hypothetical protein